MRLGSVKIQKNLIGPVGSYTNTLIQKALVLLCAAMLVAATPLFAVTAEADWDTSASNEIIGKYLQATQTYRTTPGETSMEVDIDASIPRLKESARLHALRLISQFGHISYRVMGFQGSNTVKSQVIARYLLVEQQSQGNPKLAITPANYKFKLKGESITETGSSSMCSRSRRDDPQTDCSRVRCGSIRRAICRFTRRGTCQRVQASSSKKWSSSGRLPSRMARRFPSM